MDDPNLVKVTKIRPALSITNEDVLDTLASRFLQLAKPPCTHARWVRHFAQRLVPPIPNVLYNKAACEKNDILRIVNDAISGMVPVSVRLELNEERIFHKIQAALDGSDEPEMVKEIVSENPAEEDGEPAEERKNEEEEDDDDVAPTLPSEEGSVSMLPVGSIDLNKGEGEQVGGISLTKNEEPEDVPMTTISLDKPEEPREMSEEAEEPHEEEAAPSSGIMLDKPVVQDESEEPAQDSSISLDKPASGISLDKPHQDEY